MECVLESDRHGESLTEMDMRTDGLTMLRIQPQSRVWATPRPGFVEVNQDRSAAEAQGVTFPDGEIDVFSLADLAKIEEERMAAKNSKCAASLALMLGSLSILWPADFDAEGVVLAAASLPEAGARPKRSPFALPPGRAGGRRGPVVHGLVSPEQGR